MKTIIAGSRTIEDYDIVLAAILASNFDITEVVSGTAKGVDILGERFAEDIEIAIKKFPADWDKYGKRAGYIRNEEMADYANAAICVWDGESRGTQHMINIATKKNLKLFVYKI